MQQKTVIRLVVCAVIACIILAIYFYRREGFAELAPATYLGWDGVRWDICDDFNRTRGIESMPGGKVIVDDVKSLQVVGTTHVLAKDGAGKLYLIKVDEWSDDDVQSFTVESEWLDALKAAGIANPELRDPASLYKSPR